MSSIFVSYAREDQERAQAIAQAIKGEGWTVWWDRHLLAGDAWERVILKELDKASCVVVLWSKYSVSSQWVRKEAELALERGRLVAALLDDVTPPAPFSKIHGTRLKWSWRGPKASHLAALTKAIDQRYPTYRETILAHYHTAPSLQRAVEEQIRLARPEARLQVEARLALAFERLAFEQKRVLASELLRILPWNHLQRLQLAPVDSGDWHWDDPSRLVEECLASIQISEAARQAYETALAELLDEASAYRDDERRWIRKAETAGEKMRRVIETLVTVYGFDRDKLVHKGLLIDSGPPEDVP